MPSGIYFMVSLNTGIPQDLESSFTKTLSGLYSHHLLFTSKLHFWIPLTGWNKIYFARAWTFVYTRMFAVHDCANCVLMSLLCTGAKISAKTPLCQAVYKIQITTNPQCLMSAIATVQWLFLKQYHVSRSNIWFLFPSHMLRFERAPCMCFCLGCGRAILGLFMT